MKARILSTFFILILFAVYSFDSSAQRKREAEDEGQFRIQFSKTQKSKIAVAEYLGKNQDGNHVFHAYKTSYTVLPFVTLVKMKEYLRVFDETMQWKEDVKLEGINSIKFSNYSYGNTEFREAITLNGKAYLSYSLSEKGSKTFCVREIDITEYTIGKEIKLFKYNTKNDKANGELELEFSPEKKKLLCYYRIGASKENKKKKAVDNSKKSKVRYFLIDENLKVLKDGSFTIQENEQPAFIQSIVINDLGHFCVSTWESKFTSKEIRKDIKKKTASKKKKGKRNEEEDDEGEKEEEDATQYYTFNLFFFNGTDDIIKKEYTSPNETISSLSPFIKEDNSLFLLGTIMLKDEAIENKLFTVLMDFSGNIKSENFPPKTQENEEVQKEEKPSKRKPKGKKQTVKISTRGFTGPVYFDHVVYDKDSSHFVIGEHFQHYTYTSTTTTGSGASRVTRTETRYVNHWGNILVMKYDKDGKFLWKKYIYKSFSSNTNYFIPRGKSYMALMHKNELNLLFNDLTTFPDNSNIKQKGKSRPASYLAIVDPHLSDVTKYLTGSKAIDKNYIRPDMNMAYNLGNGYITLIVILPICCTRSQHC